MIAVAITAWLLAVYRLSTNRWPWTRSHTSPPDCVSVPRCRLPRIDCPLTVFSRAADRCPAYNRSAGDWERGGC